MSTLGSSATKLLGTALSRVGTTIFQKLIRLHRVDSALRGQISKNKSIETALNDYEIIIGSYHGELTESLDKFLRELERTGLLTVIADEAILRKRHSATKAAFVKLHNEMVGDTEGSPDQLYEKLSLSFETSLEQLIKDDALAYLIRASAAQMEAHIQNVNDRLQLLTNGKQLVP